MLTIIKAETGGQWVSDKNTDQLFVMGLAQFTTCKKKEKLATTTKNLSSKKLGQIMRLLF